MKKLSVVISAYNEEVKIEDCLKSVNFADEIILIDNSSTDKTSEIGKKFNAKIFKRENNPMLNINKNFGFSKATGDWILNLDADERVTQELREEIKSEIKNPKADVNGYWIPRKNIIFGKWIQHTGWYPDHQLRLFKKGKGKFEEQHVHEMIKLNGKSDYLKNPMLHYNYDDLTQFLQKTFIIYAPNESDYLIKNNYLYDWKDSIRFPVKEFLSRFFAREGYKDGVHGLVLSLFMAFYHFVIFANIWQKKNFPEVENEEFLKATGDEIKKANKEMSLWIRQEKLKPIKNPLKKIIARFVNK